MVEQGNKKGERIDQLGWGGMQIIQNPGWFCFSLDAVLLASFATITTGDRVADLGSGTGVIPLLLSYREKTAAITGLEIQPDVLEMARRSIVLNGKQAQIILQQGDLCQAGKLLGKGCFDLVVANPPYAKAGCGRPGGNLQREISRKEIRCRLEDVIREAAILLNAQGRLALVHRPHRLTEVISLCKQYGLAVKRLRLVYPYPDREPNMVLVESVKQGQEGLTVLPPLFVYDQPGRYSKQLQEIFTGPKGREE